MNIVHQLLSYFKDTAGADITQDTPLTEEGIIDSMGVMELLAFMEGAFDVTLDMDDLTIDNFRSINDIKNLILSKREVS